MLSSAYLKNTNSLIENALAEENAGQIGIFYLDTKNETTSKIAKRVSFPIQPTKDVASSEIILHQVSERVNLRVQDQTQTKQFMRWFGDWQVGLLIQTVHRRLCITRRTEILLRSEPRAPERDKEMPVCRTVHSSNPLIQILGYPVKSRCTDRHTEQV